jgi:hypothetical protein
MVTDRKHLIEIAKQEEAAWQQGCRPLPRGIARAILFAFVHRVTTGESVEETFFKTKPTELDYEI